MKTLDIANGPYAKRLHEAIKLVNQLGGRLTSQLHGDDDQDIVLYIDVKSEDEFVSVVTKHETFEAEPGRRIELTWAISMGEPLEPTARGDYLANRFGMDADMTASYVCQICAANGCSCPRHGAGVNTL